MTNTNVTMDELRRALALVSKAGKADNEDNEQLRAENERLREDLNGHKKLIVDLDAEVNPLKKEIERLRTENDERARETERVLVKLKDVAIENERLMHQADEDKKSLAYAYQYRLEADAENERLRAQAEILEKKNDELRTALVYWKPSQCGTIYPHPVPGEVVKYCKREHGHGGAHLIETGETWA